MGGVLGPGHGLYQRLGERWAERGVEFVRVGYREPNNLDLCAHDLACGVELARDAGAERVVVMGHSFGGAVAMQDRGDHAGEPLSASSPSPRSRPDARSPVRWAGRPLLLFHGDRDELLPSEASYVVAAIAGHGEVEILPGDGHLLAHSDDVIVERLDTWLPSGAARLPAAQI